MTETFELIVCERGLGKMSAQACGKRWKIAGTAPAAVRASAHPEASAIHGERRSKGATKPAENLVQVTPKRSPDVDVLPTPQHQRARIEIEARLSAEPKPKTEHRPAELEEPPLRLPALVLKLGDEVEQRGNARAGNADEQLEAQPAPQHKEDPMPRKYEPRVCEYKPCSKHYTPTSPRQRFHPDECKRAALAKPPKGGGYKALARAPKERAAVVEPPSAPVPTHILNGYRVHVGRLQVECATLQHLVDLVEHYGGGAEPR